MTASFRDGDHLVHVLATLANPHRLRVVAALSRRRTYVSQLARELGISRTLLQAHLRKLEAAGLVSAHLELSRDGKAMKFYEVVPFALDLTPEAIATAVLTFGPRDADADANANANTDANTDADADPSGGEKGPPS
ncbi:ArsR family transcriptional regulator [Streptomyces sp. NPDC005955]|uniref:ArsR/SmtB family transcription factor n=1 Tax=Streptomyces sp. NPDC005955 TaxID=3364738 RepID=UPI0036CDC16A